ncbi:MAG: hypothetical protein WDO69_25150 [Pseudomonadota bacterium]
MLEQRGVLLRIEEGERRRLADLRHEAFGQGAGSEHAARVDGELQHAEDQLRVLPTRRRALGLLRQLAHGRLRMVEFEAIQRDLPELDTTDVDGAELLEPTLVELGVLQLHMVGEALMQHAAGPIARERLECRSRRRAAVDLLAAGELARDLENAREHAGKAPCHQLQQVARIWRPEHARFAKRRSELGEDLASGRGLALRPTRGELEVLALLAAHRDPCRWPVVEPAKLSLCDITHLHRLPAERPSRRWCQASIEAPAFAW